MQCTRAAFVAALTFLFLFSAEQPSESRQVSPVIEKNLHLVKLEDSDWRRLKEGEVIIDSDEESATKFVVARILINDTPHNVWRVLANPFEFEGKISPRMKDVEVLNDTAERSVLRCKMEVFPPLLPYISYTVESDYKPYEEVTFRRVAGNLKDFRGVWTLHAREGGMSTEVVYSMFIDPGVPVPQWIIRKGIRMELPRTLVALRDRVNRADTVSGATLRSIMAAGQGGPEPRPIRIEKTSSFEIPLPKASKVKALVRSKKLSFFEGLYY